MLVISDTQLTGLRRDRRHALLERIDDWLLKEDRAWPQAAPAERHKILDQIMTYAEQAGMQSERDFAVFARATIMLRADWQAFLGAAQQQEMLLNPHYTVNSKLRAYYNRCEITARQRRQGG